MTCKIDLSPPVILYTSVVLLIVFCLGVKFFVLFAPYVCFHILVKFR